MSPAKLVKILLFIAGTLAFCLLALFLLQRPRHGGAPFAANAEAAEKLSLETGPRMIVLTRSGTEWDVASGTGPQYRADTQKVKAVLTTLKNIEVEDVISERPENAAEFEVNLGSAAHITLYDKGGSRMAEGVFGKQAPDMTHFYFKYPDRPEVYLARGAIRGELGEADLVSWRDKTLLNLTEDQVITLFIEGPGFKTALARSSDTWSCNGRVVNPASVWGLLGVLAHLKADDFVSGLTTAHMKHGSISVQLKDGAVHTLRIGAMNPQTRRYPIAIDKDPNLFAVGEGAINSLLQKPSAFQPKK